MGDSDMRARLLARQLRGIEQGARCCADDGSPLKMSADEFAATKYSEIMVGLLDATRAHNRAQRDDVDDSMLCNLVEQLKAIKLTAIETLARKRREEKAVNDDDDDEDLSTLDYSSDSSSSDDEEDAAAAVGSAPLRYSADEIMRISRGTQALQMRRMGESTRMCGYCGKFAAKMNKCGRCKLTHFCSVGCQRKMLAPHQHECNMFAALPEKRAPGLRARLRELSTTLRMGYSDAMAVFDPALCARLPLCGVLWRVQEIPDGFAFRHASSDDFLLFCAHVGCSEVVQASVDARLFFGDKFGIVQATRARVIVLWTPLLPPSS